MNPIDPIHPILGTPSFEYRNLGLDVRTWLAGQALAGLCAALSADPTWQTLDEVAESAVHVADLLLRRLGPPTDRNGAKRPGTRRRE